MSDDQFTQLTRKIDDVHAAVCGDEYDVNKPGLLRQVQKHEVTLYGHGGNGGLNADAKKISKLFWMVSGAIILGNLIFACLMLYFEIKK